MSSSFRNRHLTELFQAFEQQHFPLDVFLRLYFRKHKAIGSHDRKYISETVYGMIRWKGLLDFLCQKTPSWEERISLFERIVVENYLEDPSIPLYARLSFPENYFSYLKKELGEEKAKQFCLESNYPAPTTIRVNQLKISREELFNRLSTLFTCSYGKHSPYAIHFGNRANFFVIPEFLEGLFEVQDEASQLVALQVQARPGDHVLDYCSGAGGKSLAIAPFMQGKGQLYLHDIRSQALAEAQKRLKRAGIQNAQFIPYDHPQKKRFWGKMDWVLIDAPCSGSGTLRRNPDRKWLFQESDIEELQNKQRQIFEDAFAFVKPKGHIVYATCSVLPVENEQQIEFFLKHFPVKLAGTTFHTFPKKGEMDGFFAATLQKY